MKCPLILQWSRLMLSLKGAIRLLHQVTFLHQLQFLYRKQFKPYQCPSITKVPNRLRTLPSWVGTQHLILSSWPAQFAPLFSNYLCQFQFSNMKIMHHSVAVIWSSASLPPSLIHCPSYLHSLYQKQYGSHKFILSSFLCLSFTIFLYINVFLYETCLLISGSLRRSLIHINNIVSSILSTVTAIRSMLNTTCLGLT